MSRRLNPGPDALTGPAGIAVTSLSVLDATLEESTKVLEVDLDLGRVLVSSGLGRSVGVVSPFWC
ncbi:MAG: hypothetical protein ABI658_28280 [Acidimicrobiales bacterium]